MKVFSVIGRNGSGKDEVVKYLQREYGVPFVSVGDMMREIARQRGYLRPGRICIRFPKSRFINLAGNTL